MGRHINVKIVIFSFLSLLLLVHIGISVERHVTTPDGQVSVVYPDEWERGVPSKGYSLLLGFIEPVTKVYVVE